MFGRKKKIDPTVYKKMQDAARRDGHRGGSADEVATLYYDQPGPVAYAILKHNQEGNLLRRKH